MAPDHGSRKPSRLTGRGRQGASPFSVVLASLLLLGGGARGAAQTVQGQLLDREDGAPVEGALIVLLAEDGRGRGGALTNPAGRFLLRAPGPGRYSLRAERIGYETVLSEPFQLSANQRFSIRLEAGTSAIQLDEIRVVGEQQCVVRPGEGLEVARVWEEARKALAVQAWTEGEGIYRFRVLKYQREIDPTSLVLMSETREVREGVTNNPIRSLPVEDLLENGFVRPSQDGGYFYYGPDAAVLLSDPFLDTHCFRLATSAETPGLVGLAFEPVRRRSTPDIEGVLWLDRETARLQFLEFLYDWAPWDEAIKVAGGRVEFQEMPSGAWIVRKWRIRMPLMAQQMGGFRDMRTTYRVIGIREVGGEVAQVASMDRQIVTEAARGMVTGVVWDSLRSTPLPGATAFLSGTAFAAVTDTAGRFILNEVAEGRYLATFTHPTFDSLGVFPGGVEVSVTPGEVSEVPLGGPSGGSILSAVCAGMDRREGEGALTGIVRGAGAGVAIAGATVRLEWRVYSVQGGREIREDVRGVEVTTNEGGRYRACGIPPGALVSVRASFLERESGKVEAELARNQVGVLNLVLDPSLINP